MRHNIQDLYEQGKIEITPAGNVLKNPLPNHVNHLDFSTEHINTLETTSNTQQYYPIIKDHSIHNVTVAPALRPTPGKIRLFAPPSYYQQNPTQKPSQSIQIVQPIAPKPITKICLENPHKGPAIPFVYKDLNDVAPRNIQPSVPAKESVKSDSDEDTKDEEVTLLNLLKSSAEVRASVLQVLKTTTVSSSSSPEAIGKTISYLAHGKGVMFDEEDFVPCKKKHNHALFIEVQHKNYRIPHTLVDNGSGLNVCPLKTATAMGYSLLDYRPTNQCVRAYDNTMRDILGEIDLEMTIGPCTYTITVQILDIESTYNLLLGRPWIHQARAVPSSFHQCIKFMHKGQLIMIPAEHHPAYSTALEALGRDDSSVIIEVPHNDSDIEFTSLTLEEPTFANTSLSELASLFDEERSAQTSPTVSDFDGVVSVLDFDLNNRPKVESKESSNTQTLTFEKGPCSGNVPLDLPRLTANPGLMLNKLFTRWGYSFGHGLGAQEQGMTTPIAVTRWPKNWGLGYSSNITPPSFHLGGMQIPHISQSFISERQARKAEHAKLKGKALMNSEELASYQACHKDWSGPNTKQQKDDNNFMLDWLDGRSNINRLLDSWRCRERTEREKEKAESPLKDIHVCYEEPLPTPADPAPEEEPAQDDSSTEDDFTEDDSDITSLGYHFARHFPPEAYPLPPDLSMLNQRREEFQAWVARQPPNYNYWDEDPADSLPGDFDLNDLPQPSHDPPERNQTPSFQEPEEDEPHCDDTYYDAPQSDPEFYEEESEWEETATSATIQPSGHTNIGTWTSRGRRIVKTRSRGSSSWSSYENDQVAMIEDGNSTTGKVLGVRVDSSPLVYFRQTAGSWFTCPHCDRRTEKKTF